MKKMKKKADRSKAEQSREASIQSIKDKVENTIRSNELNGRFDACIDVPAEITTIIVAWLESNRYKVKVDPMGGYRLTISW